MVRWNATTGTIRIGIDIGWSKKSKSCALAVRGCEPDAPLDRSWRLYTPRGEAESIHLGLFRLAQPWVDCAAIYPRWLVSFLLPVA